MDANSSNPQKQRDTEWHGELQSFFGPALSPDDPSLEPRVRHGRPSEARSAESPEKDAGNEQSNKSE